MGAFTRVDVLFQAYFVAFLSAPPWECHAIPAIRMPAAQNKMASDFRGPDCRGTICAVARPALNSVWYQKWLIHLRHRPESGGAIVRQILTGIWQHA